MQLHLLETLNKSDSVEVWIDAFVNSTDPEFDGESEKERTKRALTAYYAAQQTEEAPLMVPKNTVVKPRINIIKVVSIGGGRSGSVSLMGNGNVQEETTMKQNLDIKRAHAITKLALHKDNSLIESFVEHTYNNSTKEFPSSIQIISDAFEAYERSVGILESIHNLKIGDKSTVEYIGGPGIFKSGETFEGIWKQAAFPHQLRLDLDATLPRGAAHPPIFYDKNTGKISITKNFKLQ